MASIDRRPNGTWRARWREHPRGPQRTRAFARKRDAEAFLIEVEHQLARGTYLPAEVAATTWSDFVPVFLGRQVWRQATHDVGERALRRASEAWGDRPLPSIRTSDVQSYVKASSLAAGSLRTELQHIGAVFAMAVNDGLIVRSPMKGLRRPEAGRMLRRPGSRARTSTRSGRRGAGLVPDRCRARPRPRSPPERAARSHP